MRPDLIPENTLLAQHLAEDAGIAWRTLAGAEGLVTERKVLEYLSSIVAGGPTEPAFEPEVDFSSLATPPVRSVARTLGRNGERSG